MKSKGFFSAEAALGALLLLAFISLFPPAGTGAGQRLIATQKAHDLLIVWSVLGSGNAEMETDANLFIGTGYAIEAEGEKPARPGMEGMNGRGYEARTVAQEIIVRRPLGGFSKIKLSILQ